MGLDDFPFDSANNDMGALVLDSTKSRKIACYCDGHCMDHLFHIFRATQFSADWP
jgi:hypothetical protein